MFKSKIHPIIIPQLEHARLSGLIAHFWGNDKVDPPPVDPASFTLGVTHHDRGYGHLDTMGIGEVDEAIWLATQKRGIMTPLADAVADTVALLHIRRLVARNSHMAGAAEVLALADQFIERNIAQTKYSRHDFDRADFITDLCDMISFDFSFERYRTYDMPVFVHGSGDTQSIHVKIGEGGRVQLQPWPLSVPDLRGFLIGYEVNGYPDHPRPVTVPYTIAP